MRSETDAGYEFLSPAYRELRVYSRTDAVRLEQLRGRHAPCFGIAFKDRSLPSASSCGEDACFYRSSCLGLHQRALDSARMRENAIELASRAFLTAGSFERRGRGPSPYQASVGDLLRQWREDTPQVAFLGAFSSGKSTLINRVLGRDLLPHSRTPTTAVLTSLAHGRTPEARIEFRDYVEIPILTEHGVATDGDTLDALVGWLESPRAFSVATVEVIGVDGVPKELRPAAALARLRRIRARPRQTETLHATSIAMGRRVLASVVSRAGGSSSGERSGSSVYRVSFERRDARLLDLTRPDDTTTLGRLLTEPLHALTIRRAQCRLPLDALAGMQLLDTAGLCSPVSFHTDVTAELLDRRPDKVVVLLDSRRLDSPTNRSALAALARFVEEPEDYRRVTFALTFWDDAVRTYMLDDAEVTLDYRDEATRRRAADDLSATRRRLLRDLLERVTGVASPVEPSIFMLGLGPKAPPEMGSQLRNFVTHLQQDCAGWVGVDMWTKRWRVGLSLIEQLSSIHDRSYQEVCGAIDTSSDRQQIATQRARLVDAREAIASAIKGGVDGVGSAASAQRAVMRLEVAGLGSQKEIIAYLREGYFAAANQALDVLREESTRRAVALREVVPGAGRLGPIALDRAVLGLNEGAKERAREHVTGIGYALQSVWDLFFSGIHEATADDREAARAVLTAEMRGTFSLIDRAVQKWCTAASRAAADAQEEVDERLEQLEARQRDLSSHVQALRRKAAHLERARPHLARLQADARHEVEVLNAAEWRATAGAAPNAAVSAIFTVGRCTFKRGREADEWILFDVPEGRLLEVDVLGPGDETRRFVPSRLRGMNIELIESPRGDGGCDAPVPQAARRLSIHLVTLRGRFYADRRRGG